MNAAMRSIWTLRAIMPSPSAWAKPTKRKTTTSSAAM